jgi:hypothetical protein
MRFGMELARLARMMRGMEMMPMRDMRVMRRLVVDFRAVMLGGEAMILGRLRVMMRGLLVMVGDVAGMLHGGFSSGNGHSVGG